MEQKDVYKIITNLIGQANVLTIPRVFIDYTDSIGCALFLSQLIYWSGKTKDPDKWFYKSYKQWQEELSLKEVRLRKYIKVLKDKGIVKTKIKKVQGNPTLHFKVDEQILIESVSSYLKKGNHQNDGKETIKTMGSSSTETTRHRLLTKDNTSVLSNPMDSDIEKVYNKWIDFSDAIKLIAKQENLQLDILPARHKKVTSGFTVKLSKDKTKIKSSTIQKAIEEALESYSSEELCEYIDNYNTVLLSNIRGQEKYWYKISWKNLGNFLYSGVHNASGFKKFINLKEIECGGFQAITEIDKLRSEFKPFTAKYEPNKIFNIDDSTYYGFCTNKLRNYELIREYIQDITEDGVREYGYFVWLETVIASLLFNRKTGIRMPVLRGMMSKWRGTKKMYRSIAKEIHEG